MRDESRHARELQVLNPLTATAALRDGRDRDRDRSSARAEVSQGRCRACTLAPRCLPGTLDERQRQQFERAVQRCRPLAHGEHLFRCNDAFRSLFAVRSGCLKSYTVDPEGREHVMSFHFAGEIVGIDAVSPQKHLSSCIALGPSAVCVLPYAPLAKLGHELPELPDQLLRMVSRYLLGNAVMAGDFSAEERLAAFLVMVAARLRQRGDCGALDLAMSRQDIANYLRLAPETVSRILARFQRCGLVKADRRHITLLDAAGLGSLAASMNPYTRGD
jgi:CRP/FNR family transcriptional regulator